MTGRSPGLQEWHSPDGQARNGTGRAVCCWELADIHLSLPASGLAPVLSESRCHIVSRSKATLLLVLQPPFRLSPQFYPLWCCLLTWSAPPHLLPWPHLPKISWLGPQTQGEQTHMAALSPDVLGLCCLSSPLASFLALVSTPHCTLDSDHLHILPFFKALSLVLAPQLTQFPSWDCPSTCTLSEDKVQMFGIPSIQQATHSRSCKYLCS